ncbi:DUF1963 domain-containing protein [Streptomyces sp. Qhu-G9]|uniref:DUF1963 domain-containing protein n=1 Tax=Streptomyces sp. Qhu-G9 TaxID=3452799 RepID=UPI0022AC4148|nr:DUF1963 domain-containing protein [Streptomyces aurantiacus]WAU82220.1 DUF1963 domain-containing protein [Streptomyces aurantiacus]
MNALDEYRAAARKRDVPEHLLDRALRLARPRLELRSMDDADDPVVGQYGGRPQLPPDVEWSGFPAFIASVDCAAVPVGDLDIQLPQDGQLLFFANNSEPSDDPGPEEGRVLYVPAGTATTERAPSEENASYTYEQYPLRGRLDWFVPDTDNTVADQDTVRLIDPYLLDYMDETMNGELTLGGYANPIQYDPAPWPATGDDALILLARADYHFVDTPSFSCATSWLIHPRDLAGRNFENVRLDFQAYM